MNFAEFDEGEEVLLLAQVDVKKQPTKFKKPSKKIIKKVWFLDSGCSNHMCAFKEWFYDLDETFKSSVKLGDDSKMLVMGKGTVKLEIGGIIHVITGVYSQS